MNFLFNMCSCPNIKNRFFDIDTPNTTEFIQHLNYVTEHDYPTFHRHKCRDLYSEILCDWNSTLQFCSVPYFIGFVED
ncbi:hypothetical protein HNQ38_001759 [Desulfovibrio intestinalis]|uniref:Uncharacterized protein n=1 Tax=Desulfovibrio intestinalis TaxID=58621 RepID=A0A7W8C119_9BACT|nr:hypothetical protein [Desulfovibrio intestinalis]